MNIKKYRFWMRVRELVEKRITAAYMEKGNCDSCCPNCRQWESLGNDISNQDGKDGTTHRTCSKCKHTWRAHFCPGGFVPIGNSD